VYWSTASDRRTKERQAARRPRRWGLAAGVLVAAAAAIALFLVTRDDATVSAPEQVALPAAPAAAELAPSVPDEPAPEHALVTFVQGDVKVDGAAPSLDALLGAGARLQTGEGTIALQFEEKSAFKLEPQSALTFNRFDRRRVELEVRGIVSVDITHRRDDQEFVVVAGDHQVVVRGTAFRVALQDGELGVVCLRGAVVVTDGEDSVDVRAGQRFDMLVDAWRDAALRSVEIPAKELAALEHAMSVPMLPAWSEPRALIETSSLLEVSAEPGQAVAVDGARVANGSFQLRTMAGRHQVAAVEIDGEVGDGEWIETRPHSASGARVSAAPSAPSVHASPGEARRLRKQQLGRALGRAGRARRCLAPLAKQGLEEGAYLVFSMGVRADGSREYLNVVDSNLSPVLQQCMRRAVDAVDLPAGPAATFRYRISF
jgi:hypothetical protein